MQVYSYGLVTTGVVKILLKSFMHNLTQGMNSPITQESSDKIKTCIVVVNGMKNKSLILDVGNLINFCKLIYPV